MAMSFQDKQAEFAAYIRDPGKNPAPEDVDPQRMAIYRELFFNNMNSFLSTNFPVLRKILTEQQWLEIAQDFFANHRCLTPHFSEIAEEFLDYLQNRNHPEDLPFILELAHYEWVEMALALSTAESLPTDSNFIENLGSQNITLSPLAWPLVYQFPVQCLCPDYLPVIPPSSATYLIVYRDPQDNVHFMQSTPLIYRLLQILEEHTSMNCADCLSALSREAATLAPELIYAEGLKTLREMAVKGIIIPGGAA